jgi:phage tail P2-like protein
VTSLLPPNTTPEERAIEALASHVRDLPVPIRDLWNPATCPEAFLPWLAWALSVDIWRSDWPVETKRAVIAASPRGHRLKGTVLAVRQAAAAVAGGVPTRVIEGFQPEGSGKPFTAVVEADITDVAVVVPNLTTDLHRAASAAAPARVRLGVRVLARARAGQRVAAHIRRPLVRARLTGSAGYVPALSLAPIPVAHMRRPVLFASLFVSGAAA